MEDIELLNNEIEQLRVQLAGCGVAAMSNTRDALSKLNCEPGSYGWSASFGDCVNTVKREIDLREQLEKLKSGENIIENYVPWLELIENTIKLEEKAPNDFEIKFADGNQMLNVWFSSTEFMVIYLESAGTTVNAKYPLVDLVEWLNI